MKPPSSLKSKPPSSLNIKSSTIPELELDSELELLELSEELLELVQVSFIFTQFSLAKLTPL